MPIYVYKASDPSLGCDECQDTFDISIKLADHPIELCPFCGAEVRQVITAPTIHLGFAPASEGGRYISSLADHVDDPNGFCRSKAELEQKAAEKGRRVTPYDQIEREHTVSRAEDF